MGFWKKIFGSEPPVRAAPRAATLPEVEDEPLREARPSSEPLQSISGVACFITYRDAKGAESERTVTCHRLSEERGPLALHAYCHHRRAYRMFRLDRIRAVADLATGEVFEPASRFFDAYQQAGPPRMEMEGLSHAIAALSFIARCDGHWHVSEEQVINQFIADFWAMRRNAGDPPRDIYSLASTLSVDPELFFLVVQTIRKDEELARLVASAADVLTKADGRIASQEAEWLSELRLQLGAGSDRAREERPRQTIAKFTKLANGQLSFSTRMSIPLAEPEDAPATSEQKQLIATLIPTTDGELKTARQCHAIECYRDYADAVVGTLLISEADRYRRLFTVATTAYIASDQSIATGAIDFMEKFRRLGDEALIPDYVHHTEAFPRVVAFVHDCSRDLFELMLPAETP